VRFLRATRSARSRRQLAASGEGASTSAARLATASRDESGVALVLAIGVTTVLSMLVVVVVESAVANEHMTVQSKNRVSAYYLADAAINDAASILRNARSAYDPHLLHPQPPLPDCAAPPASPAGAPLLGDTCAPYVFDFDGGTATLSGVFDQTTQNWSITSTGQVRNPFGNEPTSITLTATIHIRAKASQNNTVPAWNYVFVRDTRPNICNLTLENTVALSTSLYVAGNLCFRNQGSLTETNPADPVSLEVRGKLVWVNNPSKGVGQDYPLKQITSAKIAGGCASSLTNAGHSCQPGNDYFYVKDGGYSADAPEIIAPMLTTTDWDGYYQNATISRLKPCLAGGLSLFLFDNDTLRNNSLATTFNLTPGSSYSCRTTDGNGAVVGELDWDAPARVLSVRGTVFVDGNVSIDGLVTYRGVNSRGMHPAGSKGLDGEGGEMVMYVSGTVSLTNSGVFCGWNTVNDTAAYNGSTCDFDAWTPWSSMFMFVANGGVSLSQSSYFQGAIFTSGAVSVGQSSQTEGPLIAGTLTIGNSAQMKPLPGLADLPLGAPGNPNTSIVIEQPIYGG